MALTKEVTAMLSSGELHEYDAIWIAKLKPDKQLAAAKKCSNATDNPLVFTSNRRTKIKIRGITRGRN